LGENQKNKETKRPENKEEKEVEKEAENNEIIK
jgi:hypothetical protein